MNACNTPLPSKRNDLDFAIPDKRLIELHPREKSSSHTESAHNLGLQIPVKRTGPLLIDLLPTGMPFMGEPVFTSCGIIQSG